MFNFIKGDVSETVEVAKYSAGDFQQLWDHYSANCRLTYATFMSDEIKKKTFIIMDASKYNKYNYTI